MPVQSKKSHRPFPAVPIIACCQPFRNPVACADNAIGNVERLSDLSVRIHGITGQPYKSLFQRGPDVKKGELLFQLDWSS